MPKFLTEIEQDDGWSRWVPPLMKGYRLGCCDCSLVHDMEFITVKVIRCLPDGGWEYKELDPAKYRVLFRARRNNRSTAAMRRNKKNGQK